MAVTYYDSEDAGAPQFTYSGTTSSIIEIFDAILVNGYGSKPGLGWTKEMTSAVEGSDRTVYKNKSASQEDMYLLVETNPANGAVFRLQIAESVTSPEVYEGYSAYAACYWLYTPRVWKAVGDERTLILFLHAGGMEGQTSSYAHSRHPLTLYVGDVDTMNMDIPRGWALLAPSMAKGLLSAATSGGTYTGTFANADESRINGTHPRVMTSLPGISWSENDQAVVCCTMLHIHSYMNAKNGFPTTEVSAFEQNAIARIPWFLLIEQKFMFRLRGVFNIFPWLYHNDSNLRLNFLTMLSFMTLPSVPQAAALPQAIREPLPARWNKLLITSPNPLPGHWSPWRTNRTEPGQSRAILPVTAKPELTLSMY